MWGHKMKRFEISYNPYNNRMHFRIAIPIDEESVSDWRELQAESSFMEFQNVECIFENNVDKILGLINCYINTTEALEIVFKGTKEDFDTLQNAVYTCSDPNAGKIICKHAEVYLSSSTALERLKRYFSKIEKDFNYFFATYPDNNGISERYINFKDAIKPEIPVCLIGRSGVGKSNLINAFMGMEVIPSQTNGVSTIVRNDSEYRIEFNYLNELYAITIEGRKYSVKTPSLPDHEIVSALFSECENCSDEKDMMRLALERIIGKNSDETFAFKLDGNVSIYIPFYDSLLNANDKFFVFVDSTVQFFDEEDDFKIVYDDKVLSQTNALPIVVATSDDLLSDDLFDLKRMIDKLGKNFARSNSIVVLTKADELVPSQMKNEIPDAIREGIADPTLIYVAPEIFLEAMRSDNKLKQKTTKTMLKTNPSQYNIIPRNRGVSSSGKLGVDKLLSASGIPSLKLELNFYADRFADYIKCANGQMYLLEATNKLILDLEKFKAQFANELRLDKEKRKEEQNTIRSEMIGIIKQKQKPDLNSAFDSIRLQFKNVLDEYCAGIPDAVRSCWERVGHRTNDVDNFAKEMRQHCQENLYDCNSDNIKVALQAKLLDITSEYFTDIEAYVKKKYESLSEDAKNALQALFEKKPQLIDVEIESCVAITLNNPIYILGSDEKIVSYYSKGFEGQLTPNGKRWGHFYKQCILDPTIAYSNQLNQWIELQLTEINKVLISDQNILSRYDDRIEELENTITDLTERIDNLNNVQVSLNELIPKSEH